MFMTSDRAPFPIQTRRVLVSPLIAMCTSRSTAEVVTLPAGLFLELCDIENEAALLHDGFAWCRCALDEMLNATEPVPESPSGFLSEVLPPAEGNLAFAPVLQGARPVTLADQPAPQACPGSTRAAVWIDA